MEHQHGLACSRQAREIVDRRTLEHLLVIGELEWTTDGVLRVVGSAPTVLQALMACPLASGRHAALSHHSALAHWGVRGFVTDPVHVTRRRDVDDHKVPRVTIHEVRFLPWNEVRVLEGIPLVSPPLALLQLAGMRTVSDTKLGRAIDAAWSDRLVAYSTLKAIDERMARQGRQGLARFRALIEERGPGYVPAASNLEGRFADILKRAGRRPMRRQIDVSSDEGWIGRVDFIDDDQPVIVEVQSARFHHGLTAEQSDAERLARLRAAGYEVVEVTDDDIFYRPDDVLRRVDAARDRARHRKGA